MSVRVMVLGGSAALGTELARMDVKALTFRTVNGARPRSTDEAKADVKWATVIVTMSSSELSHSTSWPYMNAARASRVPTLVVARRGIVALMDELARWISHWEAPEL